MLFAQACLHRCARILTCAFCPDVFASLRAHSNVRFFLGRMSSNSKKELLLDYGKFELDDDQKAAVKTAVVEAQYENAFDGFDKAAGKVTKKTADDKVAAQAKRFQVALDEKAAKDAAQKEIDAILAGLKPDQQGRMLAAMGVVASPGSVLPRVKYDHEATLKLLVKTTAPARALMETLKDDYEAVVYMGNLCDYWKSLMTQDRAQINGHAAFKKYFKKVQHLHGLPVRVKGPLAFDLAINDDDDEEAGAGAE